MLTSFQKPTISIRFNLLQVFPSVPTFVFAVLLISSFKVLRDYFLCFTQFGGWVTKFVKIETVETATKLKQK